MSFTGDVRFKTILARVLEKNELNGKSAYALYFLVTWMRCVRRHDSLR